MSRRKKPNSKTFLCNLDILSYYRVIRILDKLGIKHSNNVKFIKKLLASALTEYEHKLDLPEFSMNDVPQELHYIFEPDDGIVML